MKNTSFFLITLALMAISPLNGLVRAENRGCFNTFLAASADNELSFAVDIALFVQANRVDPSRPMIALTFDDGPDWPTLRILDILEKYGARATFFVVGERVDEWHEVLTRMHQNGFEAVGHSWDHADMTTLPAQEIGRQIVESHDAIEGVVGPIPKIFRPPFGAQNRNVRRVAEELGFAIIGWSVDPLDWYVLDADVITHRVLRDVRDGDIVLMHDLLESAADATERIVPELTARGYQLVTVSELFRYRGIALRPGIVYYSAPPRSNISPIINEDSAHEYHALVPLRAVAEALGHSVSWHAETQTVTAGDSTIKLGNHFIEVGETTYHTPVAPFISNGQTLVTTCSLHRLFGVHVCYDTGSDTVVITI